MKQIETERKFIVKSPSVSILGVQEDYTESEITQIYLGCSDATRRVRKRCYPDRTEYTENVKRRLSPLSVIEEENAITEEEFLRLSELIESGTSPLYKTRRTFSFAGHTVELDFYPEWQSTCILEVELASEDEELLLPEFIEIVREVTTDKSYSNHSMSRKVPKELTALVQNAELSSKG